MASLKIAGVQMDFRIGEVEANVDAMADRLRESVAAGAWLTVFPECAATGYCFHSLAEAQSVAEPLDGPTACRIRRLCAELNTRAVYGFLESDGHRLFNSLALIDGDRIAGTYRKVHLPMLGVDRFVTPGDRGFGVFDLNEIRIGLNICYDCSFPESARVLMLEGADLIVLPTNWPSTSGLTADVVPQARALENHVYYLVVNRIGTERGFEFIGKSRMCDPRGANLAFADHRRAEIIYADIDPALARNKHLVNVPGQHEIHRLNDRRPDCYSPIAAAATIDPRHR